MAMSSQYYVFSEEDACVFYDTQWFVCLIVTADCCDRLEDRKIRELEISERENLRHHEHTEWNSEMAKVCSIVIVKVRLTNISSYDSNTIST
jgi:hypothetical protein